MDGGRLGTSSRAGRICAAALVLLATLVSVALPASAADVAPAWATARYDNANTGSNPSETWLSAANVSSLALDWQKSVPPSVSPIVAGGVVYVGCDPGSMCALDATNGAVRWKTPVSATVPESAALVGGIVYVGGGDPFVEMALDAVSGTVVWKTLVANGDRGPDTPVAVAGGLVIQGSQDLLFAWDATTGAQRWVVKIDLQGPPAVLNGVVYVQANDPSTSPKLSALRATTGETLWTATPPTGSRGQAPVVTAGLVIVATDKRPETGLGRLSAYPSAGCGASACQPVWVYDASSEPMGNIAAAAGVVYQGFEDGSYVALDASTGRRLWTASIPGPTPVNPGAGDPTVANGLLLGATVGFVRAWPAGGCGAASCAPLWSAPLTENSWTSGDLVVVHGRLYVVDRGGVLRAFSPRLNPPPADTPPPVLGPGGPAPVRSQPTTLNVPADHGSIQRAIDASIPGDTVLVAPGVYHERLDFHGHTVEVRSAGGPDVTTIDGDGTGTVVVFATAEPRATALRGFTVRGAVTAYGGAVNVQGASPTIAGNVIAGNIGSGGNGIDVEGGAPAIVGNRIRDNRAYDAGYDIVPAGGGIWLRSTAGAEVRDNVIEGNTARAGGGIAAWNSDAVTIIGNVIRRNTARVLAGGMYLNQGTRGLVAQNVVVENSATDGPGGIAMSGRITLLGNTIAGNTASPAVLVFDQSAGTAVTGNIISGVPGETAIACSSNPPVVLDTNIVYNGDDPPRVPGVSFPAACGSPVTSVDPRFVNPRAGDYRLGQGSPTIDTGVAADLLPETDAAGAPRVVDGDGDGTATVDKGAYEAQRPVPPVVDGDGFNALPPARILDTRSGLGAPAQRLGQNQSIELQVTGRGGIPDAGVTAVVLNVTVTEPTATSFLTAWPAGVAQPLASNLNYVAGQTVPNLVTVSVGDGGRIRIYNNAGATHVIADVAGWYGPAAGAAFTAVTPSRLLDTRAGAGAVRPASTISLPVTGRGGVPASGVTAVVLNVTVTEPTATSFLTAWPAGVTRPLASNLNYVAGQTVPNLVVVKVGDGGQVNLYNHAGTAHVIVDVAGWFGDGTASRFQSLTPARILDTRTGLGGTAVKVGPASTLDLQATGRGGVPATGVSAVVLNVTVTEPTAVSFLTAWPSGLPRPLASNLNYVAGLTVPNEVVVKVGDGGKVSLYNYAGSVHVIVDVAGWYG